MGKGRRFDPNPVTNRKIEQRTKEALMIHEQIFIKEHSRDTDEQLAMLVKARAKELMHSPQMVEVTGARYIADRFGSWSKALAAAGQHMPCGTTKLTNSERYKAEYKRQATQLKVEQEQKRAERKAQQAAKRKEKPQADKSE